MIVYTVILLHHESMHSNTQIKVQIQYKSNCFSLSLFPWRFYEKTLYEHIFLSCIISCYIVIISHSALATLTLHCNSMMPWHLTWLSLILRGSRQSNAEFLISIKTSILKVQTTISVWKVFNFHLLLQNRLAKFNQTSHS